MRRLIPLVALVAGCAAPSPIASTAAPSAKSEFVYLDSYSYLSGMAEGVGCGLEIAPVLDRLDHLEGVSASAVSWDGVHFRVELQQGADRDRVTNAAQQVLRGDGTDTWLSENDPWMPEIVPPTEPRQWFDAAGTVELSKFESDLMADDFMGFVVVGIPLSATETDALRMIIRESFERNVEAANASARGVELAESDDSALGARMTELLGAERAGQIARLLERWSPW